LSKNSAAVWLFSSLADISDLEHKITS